MSITIRKDLTGQRFGRLVAINWTITEHNVRTRWLCRCDCGAFKEAVASKLINGEIRSCGCLRREQRAVAHPQYRHGHYLGEQATRTHRIWSNMKDRCENPKNKSWSRYGGRGIKVCERWQNFEFFLADMGACPDKLTIDRIDNARGYEPGNCRWATQAEQQQNRRDNVWLTVNGERMVMSEAARRHGVLASSLRLKLKAGLTPEAAIAFLQGLRP